MGNPNQMQEVANQGIKWFGQFNGIIHTVYTHDTGDEYQSILQGIKELFILEQISKNRQLDCCIVFSSLPPRGGDIISNTVNHFAEKMITRQNHKNSFPWIGISIDATMEKHQWWKISRKLLASGESGPLVISNIDIKNRINDVDDKNFKSSLSMVLENEISNSHMTHSQQTPGISNDYTAPRDELEKKIAAIWEEILGFHPVGIYDNFFDLNGSSLTATQIMSRIKELYQAEIPLKSFLEQPTIEYLAVLIKELSAEEVKNPPTNNKQ
jgi:acyl carrier protein